jgi:hypothetical protein
MYSAPQQSNFPENGACGNYSQLGPRFARPLVTKSPMNVSKKIYLEKCIALLATQLRSGMTPMENGFRSRESSPQAACSLLPFVDL